MIGCGSSASGLPGAVVHISSYNYSPSIIQSGNERQFWWCAQAPNPTNNTQNTDTIVYQAINTVTQETQSPQVVLAETAGSWDSVFTCNPRAIRGIFSNPLGDGETYTYALYYVATAVPAGVDNSIGVAFSNDGITWKKYPKPVINSTSILGYGVGQPALYNRDGKSSLVMIYEDNTPTIHHVEATSNDGIHFTVEGTLTMNGMDPSNPNPNWGDAGFDPVTNYWYAGFQFGVRNPATTGNYVEHGQYGIQIYRIPAASLLTGTTPWQLIQTIDTNLTGYESNFIPGFLHDNYGNLNLGPYPMIQVYPSISDPPPAWNATPLAEGQSGNLYNWVIGSYLVDPQTQLLALNRYSNLVTFEVTTGWIDPSAGFQLNETLGHLYETSQNGANRAIYGCKSGSTDYFVSLDPQCEGAHIQGLEGYGYATPVSGQNLVPLYRCSTGGPATFVSHDPNCESRGPGTLLGYARP